MVSTASSSRHSQEELSSRIRLDMPIYLLEIDINRQPKKEVNLQAVNLYVKRTGEKEIIVEHMNS